MNYTIRYIYTDRSFPNFTNCYTEEEFNFWVNFSREHGNKVTVKGNTATVRL